MYNEKGTGEQGILVHSCNPRTPKADARHQGQSVIQLTLHLKKLNQGRKN